MKHVIKFFNSRRNLFVCAEWSLRCSASGRQNAFPPTGKLLNTWMHPFLKKMIDSEQQDSGCFELIHLAGISALPCGADGHEEGGVPVRYWFEEADVVGFVVTPRLRCKLTLPFQDDGS